jgi:hypothetical protein
MKRIFASLATVAVVSIIAFISCDKVDSPFRVEDNTVVIDSTDTLCIFPVQSGGGFRKVLAEEYTGHLCGNCPPASIFLNDTLKPKYQDSLVVISVHAGYFAGICPMAAACPSGAPPGSFTTNFSTVVGETWYSDFNVPTNPVGMINRIGYPSSHIKAKSQWDNLIKNQLLTLATARLRINNTFDESTRTLQTCIETKFLAYLNDSIRLQIVLTEDSIINWQVWYGHTPEDEPNFLHHHVLRTDVNTPNGSFLASGNIAADSTILKKFKYENIPSAWNADHLSVVAFVYKTSNREIIQVEENKIK